MQVIKWILPLTQKKTEQKNEETESLVFLSFSQGGRKDVIYLQFPQPHIHHGRLCNPQLKISENNQ